MRWMHCALVVNLLVAADGAPVAAQEAGGAGRIRVASGAAVILRGGQEIPASPGLVVLESDGLRTGADGRLGITLKDDTRLSLGPGTEVRLDQYRYAPAEHQLALVLRVLRGAAAYVSGRIAKLAPDAVRLEAPGAIVGVRGTSLVIHVEPE
jgi:hypothetical protein